MNKCFIGDCRDTMRGLIAEGVRVQTCVTSPPYWNLRDYGVEGQLGLESTPEQYVGSMVEVFMLVRDLLADDGTFWLNLGDSYAASGKGGNPDDSPFRLQASNAGSLIQGQRNPPAGYKRKDLVGIPWMVAFALRNAGWYLRSDIVWSKPNPMPESVTDRPTKSHEYLFLFSKQEKYYYDSAAIKEPAIVGDDFGILRSKKAADGQGATTRDSIDKRLLKQDAHGPRHAGFNERWDNSDHSAMRNKRSVWEVCTQPYAEAHFATFPPKLIEPCILAGSRTGDIVLDPFFGSGTTGEVSQRLGRQWIGCELNEAYLPLQDRRTAQEGLPL